MRKFKLCALFLALCMMFGLVACNKDDKKTDDSQKNTEAKAEQPAGEANGQLTTKTEGDLNIDVIVKTTASEYWGYVVAGAEAYGKEHQDVKVDVKGASSETAYDEQINIIEVDLASKKYDGFVIAPLQADAVSQKIAGQTIPIIAVDTKIEAPEVLSFVGTGNKDAAKLGGTEAVKLAKDRGWTDIKAIAISGVQGDTTATDRLTGYKEGIEAEGGTFLDETQYADAVADKAVTSMESIMQNHPEGIAIIACNNDDMAMAAARTAKNNEAYKNTVFVGFDGIQSACNAILNGEETMSVAQEAYDMGYKAVETCVKAIRGEQVESFVDSGASIVNADNAQERLETLKKYIG